MQRLTHYLYLPFELQADKIIWLMQEADQRLSINHTHISYQSTSLQWKPLSSKAAFPLISVSGCPPFDSLRQIQEKVSLPPSLNMASLLQRWKRHIICKSAHPPATVEDWANNANVVTVTLTQQLPLCKYCQLLYKQIEQGKTYPLGFWEQLSQVESSAAKGCLICQQILLEMPPMQREPVKQNPLAFHFLVSRTVIRWWIS